MYISGSELKYEMTEGLSKMLSTQTPKIITTLRLNFMHNAKCFLVYLLPSCVTY